MQLIDCTYWLQSDCVASQCGNRIVGVLLEFIAPVIARREVDIPESFPSAGDDILLFGRAEVRACRCCAATEFTAGGAGRIGG